MQSFNSSAVLGRNARLHWLIAAGVLFAGLERIDLLAGRGVNLTPFVVMCPLLLFVAITTKSVVDDNSRRAKVGTIALALFLLFAFASLYVSDAPLSPQRFVLVMLLSTGGWSLIHIVRRTKDYAAVRKGAVLGLGAYVILDLLQYFTYQQYGLDGPNFIGVIDVTINPYGPDTARLGGGSADANRGAMVVATYAYLLLGDPVVSRARSWPWTSAVLLLGTALVILTLSRSGLLVFVLVMGGAIVRLVRYLTPAQIGIAHIAASGFVLWAVASSRLSSLTALDTLVGRLTLDGSTLSHFALIQRGLDAIGADTLLVGTGYGSSYLYLQDFFPDNIYANYHSLYVTVLLEVGLAALLVVLFLVAVPVFGPRCWLALGTVLFGVFYQAASDPIFWLQVAMFWLLPLLGHKADGPLDDFGERRRRTPATDFRMIERPSESCLSLTTQRQEKPRPAG